MLTGCSASRSQRGPNARTAAPVAIPAPDEHDGERGQHERQLPTALRPRAAPADADRRGRRTARARAPRAAHAAMVAMSPNGFRPRGRTPCGHRAVMVAPCAPRSHRRGRRSALSGSSSGAGPPSGSLAAGTVLLFDDHLNPRRGPWDTAAPPRARRSGRRVGALGQQLVPPHRGERLQLAVEHAGVLPAVPAARRRARSGARGPLPPGRRPRLARRVRGGVRRCSTTSCASASGRAVARRSVLYLALFPTSFFLGAVYGESLFLALAVGTFALAERGRLGWAAITAGLALLTRAQGVALLPALASSRGARAPRAATSRCSRPGRDVRSSSRSCSRRGSATGSPSSTHSDVWERSLAPLGPLGGLVQAIGEGDVVGPVLAIAMLALGDRRLARCSARRTASTRSRALALPMALPSERLGGLYSFPRFALVAFPVPRRAGRPRPRPARPRRRRRGSLRRARGRRGSMGAVVLGRLTEVPRPRLRRLGDPRHGSWRALSYAAQPRRGGDPPDDVLYQWSTAVGGADRSTRSSSRSCSCSHGASRRRPSGCVGRVLGHAPSGWIVAALVAIWVIGAILNIFLKAGEEQGLVPDGWDADRAAPFVANFVVVAVVAPFVEELTYRGLGFAAVRDALRGRRRRSSSRRSRSGSPTGWSSRSRCSRSSARSSPGCASRPTASTRR